MPLGPPLNLRARANRSEVDAMQIRVKTHQVVSGPGAYICVMMAGLCACGHSLLPPHEIHGIVSTVEENAR
jgi:hypothetical protein